MRSQASFRIDDIRTSQQFLDGLETLGVPLPWSSNESGEVLDASGIVVCDTSDHIDNGYASVAAMIALAMNACGTLRATQKK